MTVPARGHVEAAFARLHARAAAFWLSRSRVSASGPSTRQAYPDVRGASYRHLEWRRPVPDARGGRGGWWRYSHKHWLDQRRPHCRAVTPQLTIGSDVLKPVYSHLCSQLGVTVVTVDSEAFLSLLWVSAMVWSRQTPQGAVLVTHTAKKPLLPAHMIRCADDLDSTPPRRAEWNRL